MKSTWSNAGSSSTSTNYTDELSQIAPTWQDEADNEEWSAWVDETGSSPATRTEDDEFGAWVDSTDVHTSADFQTSTSTSFISPEEAEGPLIVTVRELRRMNSL